MTLIKYLPFYRYVRTRVRIDLSEFHECAIKIKIKILSAKLRIRGILPLWSNPATAGSAGSGVCVREEKESAWNSLRKAFP